MQRSPGRERGNSPSLKEQSSEMINGEEGKGVSVTVDEIGRIAEVQVH